MSDIHNRYVNLTEGTTSNYTRFAGYTGSVPVAGLFGCTSVIAISKRGAGISHHWEVPSFAPSWMDFWPPADLEQQEIFRQEVLLSFHRGKGSDHVFELSELRDRKAADDLLISHLMDDDADPRVFIFAPYERSYDVSDPNYNNEFPIGLPEAFGQDDGLPSKNQQIQNEIRAIFSIPNAFVVPYEKVLYAPRMMMEPDEDLKDSK